MWALLTKLDAQRRIDARCQHHLLEAGYAQADVWVYSTTLDAVDDFAFSRDFQIALIS